MNRATLSYNSLASSGVEVFDEAEHNKEIYSNHYFSLPFVSPTKNPTQGILFVGLIAV